tara:strand:- start:578 stop:685 length:108 start_codon:yes stop_codon:yes gene_type:complete
MKKKEGRVEVGPVEDIFIGSVPARTVGSGDEKDVE